MSWSPSPDPPLPTAPLSLSVSPGSQLSLGPPAARHFCHSCECEVSVVELPDLELECAFCKATCVELLEDEALVRASSSASTTSAPLSPWVQMAPPPPLPPNMPHRLSLGSRTSTLHRRHRVSGVIGQSARLSQAARHVGIRCDGCNARDFAGTRYRCLRCTDFDFCASCHSQRSSLHPEHDFEAIVTPRGVVPPFLADFLARAAARTSIAIIGIGMGGGGAEATSGLTDSHLAWWLADSRRLVSVDQMTAQDPLWCCPICAEGLEGECENGWVVQICGPPPTPTGEEEASSPGSRARGSCDSVSDGISETATKAAGEASGGTEAEKEPDEVVPADRVHDLHAHRHVYHEACLRKWLLKRNSCPVCRRRPVV